jgi:hypothetical protein
VQVTVSVGQARGHRVFIAGTDTRAEMHMRVQTGQAVLDKRSGDLGPEERRHAGGIDKISHGARDGTNGPSRKAGKATAGVGCTT